MEFKFTENGDVLVGTDTLLEDENDILTQHLALLFKSFPGDLKHTPYGLSPISLVEPLSKKVMLEEYTDMINDAMINDPIIKGQLRCVVSYSSETNLFTVSVYETNTNNSVASGVYGKNNFIESVFEKQYSDKEDMIYYNAILEYRDGSIILPNKTIKNQRIVRILEPTGVDNTVCIKQNYVVEEGNLVNISDIVFDNIKSNHYFIEKIETNIDAKLIQDDINLYLEAIEHGYCELSIYVVELDSSEIPKINRFNTAHLDNMMSVPHYDYKKYTTELMLDTLIEGKKYRVKTTRLVKQNE